MRTNTTRALRSPYSVHIPALQGFSCDVLVAANRSAYPQDGTSSQVASHKQHLLTALAALNFDQRLHAAALAELTLHYMAQQTSDRGSAARLLKLWGLFNGAGIASYLLEVIAVKAAASTPKVDMAATLRGALQRIASVPSVVRIVMPVKTLEYQTLGSNSSAVSAPAREKFDQPGNYQKLHT